jgi:hypothetical protein
VGLQDVSTYPALFAELASRGYTDSDLKKLAGQNLVRVFRAVEQVRYVDRNHPVHPAVFYMKPDTPGIVEKHVPACVSVRIMFVFRTLQAYGRIMDMA